MLGEFVFGGSQVIIDLELLWHYNSFGETQARSLFQLSELIRYFVGNVGVNADIHDDKARNRSSIKTRRGYIISGLNGSNVINVGC